MLRFISTFPALFLLGILVSGCASKRTTQVFAPSRFIELQREQSIATVHFPVGTYALDSSDAEGYYYRAPRPIVKHTFAGPSTERGGLFLSKSNRQLRGYIFWAGGLTRIGRVPPGAVVFRD